MKNISILMLSTALFFACSSDDDSNPVDPTTTSTAEDITSVVQNNFLTSNEVAIALSENSITITSTGLPEHKTPYWGEDHELYEPFPTFTYDQLGESIYDLYDADELDRLWNDDKTEVTFAANANTEMISFSYSMTIPTIPTEATNKEATDLGLIGMALNGVPIYNNFEGRDVLGSIAMSTFDAAGAHPGPTSNYHYHTTGVYTTVDDDNLIGFLRDGFPIYGRQDMDGTYPEDLDENGGHTGTTEQFPEEIYHYHTSNENYLSSGWYVLKSGNYHGTPGAYTE